MAGKKDIVEQALKLIAGGAKEAGPSVAERAANNAALLKDANRLGVNTNDINALNETKALTDFHKKFMGDVKSRAAEALEAQKQLREQGAFPLEIGSRFTTAFAREKGQGPHTVQGYFVNPQDPFNSYGYRVRQDLGDGDWQEYDFFIRDPRTEARLGPEKWQEHQRGIVPMTGPKVVKAYGGSIREGYGPGGWVDDVVKMAGKVISGEGEDAAKAGIRAYHGSPQKGLKRLSARYAVETPDAVFAAQNPDVAHTFTVPREYGEPVYVDEFGNDIEPGEVFELDLRPQNPFSVPPEDAQKFIDDTAFQTRLVREAREKGHDLVVAPNVMEGIGERSPGDVYAVLDDRIISIIRKYGIAGASAMLGYNLMEQLGPKQALAASMADQDYQSSRPQRSMGGNNSISGALNVARGLNGVE